ncbi:MAG: thermonuclease family protein [Candidatus Omnitrophica bacterium]|nr:thermonuclease family protein [Candidatus Omnitrophota bacterium]
MTSTLSAYPKLISRLKRLSTAGKSRIEKTRLQVNWDMGRAIDRYILKYQKRAPKGSFLLVRLARDLNFKKTYLYYCLEFARAYPFFRPDGKMKWGHYEALLTVNDPALRERLTKQAAAKGWSKRVLRAKIRQLKAGKDEENILACLLPKKGKIGEYGIFRSGTRWIADLGFEVYHNLPPGRKYEVRMSSYTYKAEIERVIDGDTVWAKVSLNANYFTHQKLRLRGIDTPELTEPAGRKAKSFLQGKLKPGKEILITTSKSDKYDRYLADIWAGKTYINQTLLDKGLAALVYSS